MTSLIVGQFHWSKCSETRRNSIASLVITRRHHLLSGTLKVLHAVSGGRLNACDQAHGFHGNQTIWNCQLGDALD